MADKKRRMTDEERAAIEARIFQYNPDAKNPYDTEDGMSQYITSWDDTIRNMALGWLSNPGRRPPRAPSNRVILWIHLHSYLVLDSI